MDRAEYVDAQLRKLTMGDLTDDQLQKLYTWIDEIPLSRPKRNIARDFADGLLLAEVVKHYFPRLVELHNYPAANSTQQKMYNWNTLNTKVLRKLGYNLSKDEIEAVIQCRPNAIEKVLNTCQIKMARYRARAASRGRAGTPTSARGGRGTSPAPGSSSSRTHRGGASPAGSAGGRLRPPYDPYQQQVQMQQQQQQQQQQRQPPPPPGAEPYVAGANMSERAVRPTEADYSRRQQTMHREVDQEMLMEREQTIQEYKETVEILELKIAKLEQLVRLKDSKISKLQTALNRQQPQDP